ncbi:fungal-specific transcription factor domain-containing protein [Aspergillus cavernicola]|uniref:Fungal-specific transcription factor domain-containing protein n=1 Tax=Aspergillus cavernicola TaxID=176166 RepID=A0ABR4HUY2_9EURO
MHLTERFPESCYSLYLVQPTNVFDSSPTTGIGGESTRVSLGPMDKEIFECLNRPFSFYTEQLEEFLHQWEAFCPVLTRKQLAEAVYGTVRKVQELASTGDADASSLCILFSIMSINLVGLGTRNRPNASTGFAGRYISLATRLQDSVIARGDVSSLQALVLFAFYHQLTGQSLSLIGLNGVMVRIAQSLGLHRHARRFRMTVAEIELRKRIWWWIYIFDRITAIMHGLPPLISDADVDNDMPSDCRLDDLNVEQLDHPLPGQTTTVFFFVHYATMGKKLSSILDLLYTTTERRQGAVKIERLDGDIRVWSQNLGVGDVGCEAHREHEISTPDGRNKMLPWLRLLINFSIILIHRPGLTFADNTPEFANSLGTCTKASTDILHLISAPEMAQIPDSFCPVGPGLVFQCALMHIYCQCKIKTLDLVGLPSLHDSIGIISKAVDILGKYYQNPQLFISGNLAHGDFYMESISITIKVLKDLMISLHHTKSQLPMLPWSTDIPLPDTSHHSITTSSLYDLNYMTAMDWAQDISDTFGHLPDLGG